MFNKNKKYVEILYNCIKFNLNCTYITLLNIIKNIII